MESCFRCGRTEEEVKLYDGIFTNGTVRICEKCSLIENIPLVKVPSTDQLRNSEKGVRIYNRLQKMAGLSHIAKEKTPSEQLKDLQQHPEREKPEEKPVKFVENFHWIIQHERRRKGLTQKQLADTISESEKAIQLIERNNLPENSLPVIKKLEQFFRVRLIKTENIEQKMKPFEIRAVEREGSINLSAPISSPITISSKPTESIRALDFKRERIKDITISDLKEIQRVIEQDYPTKSREQIGKEQFEDFGKAKLSSKPLFSGFSAQTSAISQAEGYKGPFGPKDEQGKTPTIDELMEKKKFREKEDTSLLGDDIELVEEEKK